MLRRVIIIVLVAVIAIGGYFAARILFSSSSTEEVIVQIPEGASFNAILDSLESRDLITSRTAFRLFAIATGNDGKIKPGAYKFTRGLSEAELLNALVEGRSTVKVKLTFPEGITIRRMAAIAAQQLESDSAEFVHLANDRAFLQTIGVNGSTPKAT